MRFKTSLLLNIILSLLVASLLLFFSQKEFFRRIELASLDFLFRLRGNLPFNPRIILVEITDADISKIGRWPWKRSWYAAMTRALCDLGAKQIYFDIVFSEGASEEEDALFQEAIKQAKNVYLPFAFQDNLFQIKNALLPLKRFSLYLKGTGAINIYPDIDGTLRKTPFVFLGKEGVSPHIVSKLAMDYDADLEKIKIPLVEKNKLLINWTGKWQNTFKHYSFLDILAGYQDFLEKKKPEINLADFKASICLVGVTAIGLYDIISIPLEPEYPAIGVIANALSNLLNRSFLRDMPNWMNVLLIYLLALMPAILMFGERPLRQTFLVFVIGAIYFLINLFLFKQGLRFNLSTPLLGLSASYLLVEAYNFVRLSVEKKTLFRISVTDGLTGLYNIRYFKLLLETEIMLAKSDPNKRFSILMADLDRFKYFNDTYGHPAGDLALKEVASVLKNSVRASDIVARYGGEEMILLLRGSSLKESLNIAEKIRKNVENLVIRDQNNTYKITLSLGIATFKPRDTPDAVIKRADDGLYKAKQAGRNRVCNVEELT